MVSTQLHQLSPPSTYPPHISATSTNSAAATYLGILSQPSLPIESSANAPPHEAMEDVAAHAEQSPRRELAAPLHPKVDIIHAMCGRLSVCLVVAEIPRRRTIPYACLSTR